MVSFLSKRRKELFLRIVHVSNGTSNGKGGQNAAGCNIIHQPAAESTKIELISIRDKKVGVELRGNRDWRRFGGFSSGNYEIVNEFGYDAEFTEARPRSARLSFPSSTLRKPMSQSSNLTTLAQASVDQQDHIGTQSKM